ncbi:DddA-like double-stranded DNA deaminase toxin [Kribbella sp. WER1]
MPSELQRVAQDLVDCLDRIPSMVDYLHRLAAKCRENAAMIAGMGSANPGAGNAAMLLDAAARACDEAAHYAAMAPPKARGWAEQMVSGARTADGPKPTSGGGTARVPDPGGQGSDDGFDPGELLKQLPKRDVGPGRRVKTRGTWHDDSGRNHPLVSGQHEEDYQAAQRHAERLGLVTPPYLLSTAADVELKFAMRMRREGITNARIVLNQKPCKGELSCHTLLKRFLAPGSRLTVYAPDFEYTYEGEAEADGDD